MIWCNWSWRTALLIMTCLCKSNGHFSQSNLIVYHMSAVYVYHLNQICCRWLMISIDMFFFIWQCATSQWPLWLNLISTYFCCILPDFSCLIELKLLQMKIFLERRPSLKAWGLGMYNLFSEERRPSWPLWLVSCRSRSFWIWNYTKDDKGQINFF